MSRSNIARQYASTVVRLDHPAEAAAFEADADAALATMDEPVLLDEWQAVPEVLGAVKRAVDDDSRPGRFLLTGSVQADLDAEMWPGTGRLVRLNMHGLCEREIAGATASPSPFDLLAGGDPLALTTPPAAPDLPGHIELALRGGFPDAAVRLEGAWREQWLASYLDQILTRDAVHISGRDPVRLARYFEALALNSAGIVSDTTLIEAAGVDRKTAFAYERLLANLFVLDVVPVWLTNRLSRLVKTPKRYITDPALIGAALRMDTRAVMRDGGVLGRVLDTFVAAQIRPEAGVTSPRPRLFHLREKNGRREIDLMAELGGDRVVAIEVKARRHRGAPMLLTSSGCETDWASNSSQESFSIRVRRPSRCPIASRPHQSHRCGHLACDQRQSVLASSRSSPTQVKWLPVSPAPGPPACREFIPT